VRTDTVWGRGSRILFGQMYEDVGIEMQAFRPGSRVFCIASGGCSAIAMSAVHQVTAVDINRDQLDYAKQRAGGASARYGRADLLMGWGRRLMRVAGWSRSRLERFVNSTDCGEQLQLWERSLNVRRFRFLFDTSTAIGLQVVRLLAPSGASLPGPHIGASLRSRLHRGLVRFPNAANPYARRQFLGELPKAQRAQIPIDFWHADAAEYLESCPAASYDAFTLSNIADGVTADYYRRLIQAVKRAAAPDAVAVLRSFREPKADEHGRNAAEDRSMIWGSIFSGPVESL
jgi:S-adenosylmethionine:diacylglycerol 3-amino-3-carboxypropyl transferase